MKFSKSEPIALNAIGRTLRGKYGHRGKERHDHQDRNYKGSVASEECLEREVSSSALSASLCGASLLGLPIGDRSGEPAQPRWLCERGV